MPVAILLTALLLQSPAVVELPPPAGASGVSVRITSPRGRMGLPGTIRIVAQIRAENGADPGPVRFFIDGALYKTDEDGAPYVVEWEDVNPFERREIAVAGVGCRRPRGAGRDRARSLRGDPGGGGRERSRGSLGSGQERSIRQAPGARRVHGPGRRSHPGARSRAAREPRRRLRVAGGQQRQHGSTHRIRATHGRHARSLHDAARPHGHCAVRETDPVHDRSDSRSCHDCRIHQCDPCRGRDRHFRRTHTALAQPPRSQRTPGHHPRDRRLRRTQHRSPGRRARPVEGKEDRSLRRRGWRHRGRFFQRGESPATTCRRERRPHVRAPERSATRGRSISARRRYPEPLSAHLHARQPEAGRVMARRSA